MLRVAVDEYMQIVSFLEVLGTDSPWDHLRKAGLNPRVLSSLRAACKKLGLRVTLKHFEDLFDAFEDSEKTAENLRQNASSLAGTLRRELSTKLFLTLPDDASIESFENERPFDTESISVNERFSDAIYDMQEAANCLALGRATACVFHLMRVLEVGLSALANELKIPWPSHNDWQGVINAIEGRSKRLKRGVERYRRTGVRSGSSMPTQRHSLRISRTDGGITQCTFMRSMTNRKPNSYSPAFANL
ncbi:MAG TPA: hypothetical protein VNF45_01145 [Candidatus Binataceae bacterium]|nr:hypothetical protein [Candidatus Binataceae bacterium]